MTVGKIQGKWSSLREVGAQWAEESIFPYLASNLPTSSANATKLHVETLKEKPCTLSEELLEFDSKEEYVTNISLLAD